MLDDFEDEVQRETEAFKQSIQDYQALLNRVFSQSEDGKRLLARWVKDHVFTPTVVAGQPLEMHGIKEGKATFVRDIVETIEMINNNYYQPKDNSDE